MHPPLDRPHPDCYDIIQQLKQCHIAHPYKKYLGVCNTIKFDMDKCLKKEKKRLLDECNAVELPSYYQEQQTIIKEAFGQKMTFQEYLQQDKEYNKIRQQQQQKDN